MQLTVDTTWWTRYRSRTGNPDLGDTFPQAIPTLAVGQHTAIPRTDEDLESKNFLQAIGNTAGFHFATIEQGGSSLYPKVAQRVTSLEVLRIVLSIGGTEIMHFQTWSDKAGNAKVLHDVVDPVTGVHVTFPNLNAPPFGGEDFQTNLIMPEPGVPQPEASSMLDHSPDPNQRRCHGSAECSHRGRPLHRPVERVLQLHANSGDRSRSGGARIADYSRERALRTETPAAAPQFTINKQ